MLYGEYKMIACVLYIMLSVGPWTGSQDPNYIIIPIKMVSEQACRDAQYSIMLNTNTYSDREPNLLINVDCQPAPRPVLPEGRLDYRECLDIVPEV